MTQSISNGDEPSMADFPSETDRETGVRLYDGGSLENYLALLSHYLHNRQLADRPERRLEIMQALLDFLAEKSENEGTAATPEELEHYLAEPEQLSLFSDFFQVPYANPAGGRFTFIDLFAGIGGIRLPFTEMGYRCVFSSEWDKNAQRTYLANFGEMPFGDRCRESTKKLHTPRLRRAFSRFPMPGIFHNGQDERV